MTPFTAPPYTDPAHASRAVVTANQHRTIRATEHRRFQSRCSAANLTDALFMWAGVTVAVILLAGTQAVCGRIRAIRLQHAIDTLVGDDGHKPRQP